MAKKKINSGVQESEKHQVDKAKTMKQKQKAILFAKIYREFSRRKYNKYKLQYPRLRESEIINKIIKEWQALSEDDKIKLQKIFLQTGGDKFLKDDSKSKSKSKSKSESSSKQKQIHQEVLKQEVGQVAKPVKKKKKTSPKVRVFVEKATDANKNYLEDSDFKDSSKEKKLGKEESSSESVVIKRGTKKFKKGIQKKKIMNRQNEYLIFFKYYYSRLGAEHPRWTSPQITAIIKLLWRKRNLNTKGKQKRKTRNLQLHPISGRVMYRKEKEANGHELQEIKMMWRQLPYESKKYWELKGRGGAPKLRKNPSQSITQLKKVMKAGSTKKSEQTTNFTWMDNSIKSS